MEFTRKKANRTVLFLFILVSFSSIVRYVGTVNGIDLLKYLSVCAQVLALYKILRIITFNHKLLNLKVLLPSLFILFFYPFLRILFTVVENFTFKSFTDGFFVYGGYYQLVILGVGLAILTPKIQLERVLFNYSKLTLPLAFVALFMVLRSSDFEFGLRLGHQTITNFLIPCSLLSFFPFKKKYLLTGLFSIFLILFLSSVIASRSYTIVGFLLFISSQLFLLRNGKKHLVMLLVTIILPFYTFGGFSFFQNSSPLLTHTSISEKFNLESLYVSLENSLNEGDLSHLYYWEGNSRAAIIEAAFLQFDFIKYLFGVSLFKTYDSFVERSTIEIGWLQETFRWGVIYALLSIFLFTKGFFYLKKKFKQYREISFKVLQVIVLIKLIDAFIFGMPEMTVYNFLVFWGVMTPSVYFFYDNYTNV